MPDLALLLDAAEAAGSIALGQWRNAPETWTKPDASPVSAADLAVDEALRIALTAARPDYGWLSEETADTPRRRTRERCFIVDPIDGTRAYLDGHRDWALSLAIAERGEIVAGVIHMPARGATYAAARGQGATLDGQPIRAADLARSRAMAGQTGDPDPDAPFPAILDGARILAARPALDPRHWHADVPPVSRHFRSSMAYRLALVAAARFDAMLTLRPAWEWDIAAGALIAAEAGARVTDRHGAPLAFNSETARTPGILAAPAPLHGALLKALA